MENATAGWCRGHFFQVRQGNRTSAEIPSVRTSFTRVLILKFFNVHEALSTHSTKNTKIATLKIFGKLFWCLESVTCSAWLLWFRRVTKRSINKTPAIRFVQETGEKSYARTFVTLSVIIKVENISQSTLILGLRTMREREKERESGKWAGGVETWDLSNFWIRPDFGNWKISGERKKKRKRRKKASALIT